jgi:hypothetical protein
LRQAPERLTVSASLAIFAAVLIAVARNLGS